MEKDQPLTVGGNLAAFGQPSVLAESTDLLVFKVFFILFLFWTGNCPVIISFYQGLNM